ncbi:C2H2-type zinc finger protein [Halorussus salinisoli]|nr:C2H2-type zinc finger protein [Halorussus salinisoli]
MADEYECDMCGATFVDQEELEEHAREEHGKEM